MVLHKPQRLLLLSLGKGGPTNEVVGVVDGIRQKRLGGGDIIVSEMGLGTQRWASADFNAPDEALCHKFMDRAILESGVNLIDTAEQYPIPSDFRRPEVHPVLLQANGTRSQSPSKAPLWGGAGHYACGISVFCFVREALIFSNLQKPAGEREGGGGEGER